MPATADFLSFKICKSRLIYSKLQFWLVNNIKSVHFQQSNFGAYEDTLSKLQEN